MQHWLIKPFFSFLSLLLSKNDLACSFSPEDLKRRFWRGISQSPADSPMSAQVGILRQLPATPLSCQWPWDTAVLPAGWWHWHKINQRRQGLSLVFCVIEGATNNYGRCPKSSVDVVRMAEGQSGVQTVGSCFVSCDLLSRTHSWEPLEKGSNL